MKRFITIQELAYLLKYRKIDCNSPFHGKLQKDNLMTNGISSDEKILFAFTTNYFPVSLYRNLICIHFKSNFKPVGEGIARYTWTSTYGDYDWCGGRLNTCYSEGYLYEYSLNDIEKIEFITWLFDEDEEDETPYADIHSALKKKEMLINNHIYKRKDDTISEEKIKYDVELVNGIEKQDIVVALNYIANLDHLDINHKNMWKRGVKK